MGITYNTSVFEGKSFPHVWNQTIITPTGYALMEIVWQQDVPPEEGTTIAEVISTFLQTAHTLSSLRLFLSSPVLQRLETLVLCIPSGTTLFIAVKGKGKVFLCRSGKVVPLLLNPGVLKGTMKMNDLVIAISGSIEFPLRILEESLKSIISTQQATQTVEQLLETHQSAGKGLVLQYKQEEIQEKTFIKKQSVLEKLRVQKKLQILARQVRTRQFQIRAAAVFLGLVFIFSVVLGIRKQQTNSKYSQLESVYKQAKQYFDEALPLMDVRRDDGKQSLQKAKALLDPLFASPLPKSKISRDIEDLKKKIDDSMLLASRVIRADVVEYFDAGILRQGKAMDEITRIGDTVFFLDRTEGFVGGIALPTKNADAVSLSTLLKQAKNIAGDKETLFVLKEKEILKISPDNPDPQVVPLSFDDISSFDFITSYGTNLYILDSVGKQLWRYTINDTQKTYGKPQRYFAEGTAPDMSDITSVVIDGSVWMGTKNGKIRSYTQGKESSFFVRGLDTPITGPVFVYTSELTNYVYALDSEQKRVVVFSKEGVYQGQYTWSSDINATAIVVSEQQKKVILLANKKLYSFALQ